jgi:hypothetical protein
MRGESWITHAGGAGRLIQLRGPDRHRSGFDCAMFMAARGYLVRLLHDGHNLALVAF